MRFYCTAQGTITNLLWWNMMEDHVRKIMCVCACLLPGHFAVWQEFTHQCTSIIIKHLETTKKPLRIINSPFIWKEINRKKWIALYIIKRITPINWKCYSWICWAKYLSTTFFSFWPHPAARGHPQARGRTHTTALIWSTAVTPLDASSAI